VLIRELTGVGAETAAKFEELGIRSAADLLNDFPFRYEDMRFPTPAAQIRAASDAEINAVGTIVSLKERRARGLAIIEAQLADDSGTFAAKWFGRGYLVGSFKPGLRLFVRGRVTHGDRGTSLNVTTHRVLSDGEVYRGEVVPVYNASKNLTSRKIHQVIIRNLPRLLELAGEDPLPRVIVAQEAFPVLHDAYRNLHAPDSPEAAANARQRFIYTEFLTLALQAQLKRARREQERIAPALHVPPALLDEFEASLPFALTHAQRRVIAEIWNDMRRCAWVSGQGRHSGLSAQSAFTVATPWDEFGRVPSHTHTNPYENVLSAGNVSGSSRTGWRNRRFVTIGEAAGDGLTRLACETVGPSAGSCPTGVPLVSIQGSKMIAKGAGVDGALRASGGPQAARY